MRKPKSAAADRLERLWSPWRMTYVRSALPDSGRRTTRRTQGAGGGKGERDSTSCLFCRVRAGRDDRADLVLARRPAALLMLNRFPYNPAHLMVAVARHAARFAELDAGERLDLLELTALAEDALAAEYHPDGVNYGANVGRVAGAGYPGHLHLHLVPRWNGDTNFMPTLAGTKVLPESLGRTWKRLRKALAEIGRANPAGRSAGRPGAALDARAERRGGVAGDARRTRR